MTNDSVICVQQRPRAVTDGTPDHLGVSDKFHARLIAGISLGVTLLTGLAMLGIFLVVHQGGTSTYADAIRAFSASRENLGRATLISGLTLIMLSGWLTWFIALFSSFRVAGPLYRLCRNLESAKDRGSMPIIGLRQGDCLQESMRSFEESIKSLRLHRLEMEKAAERASRALSGTDLFSRETVVAMVVDLQRQRRDVEL